MSTKRTKARAPRVRKATRKSTAKRVASKKRAAKATKPRDPGAPAVGTTLTRVFKKKTYELVATATGWRLGDVEFRTLTAAAKAVTKYGSISGPRFWLGTGTEKAGA